MTDELVGAAGDDRVPSFLLEAHRLGEEPVHDHRPEGHQVARREHESPKDAHPRRQLGRQAPAVVEPGGAEERQGGDEQDPRDPEVPALATGRTAAPLDHELGVVGQQDNGTDRGEAGVQPDVHPAGGPDHGSGADEQGEGLDAQEDGQLEQTADEGCSVRTDGHAAPPPRERASLDGSHIARGPAALTGQSHGIAVGRRLRVTEARGISR